MKLKKLKRDVDVKSGKNIPTQEQGFVEEFEFPLYGANGVIGSYHSYNIKEPKIIVGRVGSAGEVNIALAYSWISDNALILDNKKDDIMFLYYCLKSPSSNLNRLVDRNANPLLSGGKLKTVLIPDLDKQSQIKIVKFLDNKTSLIDKKISLLEKKIELYEEYKKQMIYNTITKGLKSKTQMKNVNLAWIKEIPSHWKIAKIKSEVLASKGKNASKYNQEYVKDETNQGEYPVYSGQTENDGLMASINSYEYDLKECLFVTTVGAKAMTHKKIKGKFNLSQNCALLELKNPQDSFLDFYYYMLFPLFNSKLKLIPSHMQPSLTIEEFKTFEIIIPPKNEQEDIACFLSRKITKIDKLIELTKKEIELQKEYKKTLINDVVTGKIEV